MASNLRVDQILPTVGTNVAIGTATGTVTLAGTTSGTFSGNLTGTASTATAAATAYGLSGSPTLSIGAGSTSAPSISPSGDPNTGIFFPSADTIAFAEGGAEAARIDSSGKIGVNVTPSAWQTSSNSSVIQIKNSYLFDYVGQQFDIGLNSYYDGSDYRYISSAAATRYTQTTGEHRWYTVGSGTAGNTFSWTERMRINNVGGLKVSANNSAFVSSSTNGSHEITTDQNGSEALYIVNRNSTSPLGAQIYYSTDINNTANYFLTCYGTSTLRAGFRSNGGLANYSANNVNLSDRNVKKDIAPAAGTWNCLKEWEIVNFRYKDQPDDADLNMGVIAQQIAENCPEVIQVFQEAKEATETESAQEERIGVKEQQMMWMAIKALQEAQLRIEALEAEVAALKAQ